MNIVELDGAESVSNYYIQMAKLKALIILQRMETEYQETQRFHRFRYNFQEGPYTGWTEDSDDDEGKAEKKVKSNYKPVKRSKTFIPRLQHGAGEIKWYRRDENGFKKCFRTDDVRHYKSDLFGKEIK